MTHMYQRVLRAVMGREETGVKKEGPRVGVCMLDFREDQFDHEPCQGSGCQLWPWLSKDRNDVSLVIERSATRKPSTLGATVVYLIGEDRKSSSSKTTTVLQVRGTQRFGVQKPGKTPGTAPPRNMERNLRKSQTPKHELAPPNVRYIHTEKKLGSGVLA